MKSIEKRDSVKLYAGVLLCTIMSVVAVIIVGNRDILYDRFVTGVYGNGSIISIINQKVIIAGTEVKVIPLLPFNIKAVAVALAVFRAGCTAVQLRTRKGVFVALSGLLMIMVVQWWFIFKSVLYIPIVEILSFSGITYVMLSLIKFIVYRYNTKNLPIGAVVKFVRNIVNMESETTYANYLLNNKKQIEKSLSAELIHPAMTNSSGLLKKLSDENHRNKKFVETQLFGREKSSTTTVVQTRTKLFRGVSYLAFIPMPVIDKNSEELVYTVIGLERKLGVQRASHISTMLFSMYIYFWA